MGVFCCSFVVYLFINVYFCVKNVDIYSFVGKKERQNIIKEIIRRSAISSQDILLQMLLGRGVDVTQATLSRDIKELKIIKMPLVDGKYSYQLPAAVNNEGSKGVPTSVIQEKIEFSGNLAILKTRPGYAMAIAGDIDQVSPKEILGTVAGDDTILLVIRENISRDEVLKALSQIINL